MNFSSVERTNCLMEIVGMEPLRPATTLMWHTPYLDRAFSRAIFENQGNNFTVRLPCFWKQNLTKFSCPFRVLQGLGRQHLRWQVYVAAH